MATELDSIVEAYEQARSAGNAGELRRYLPPRSSESYRDVALELMRVDMEYGWRSGVPRRLDEYLAEYADVLRDPQALKALAFEEFRQRAAAGQFVAGEEYASRYHFDTGDWPAAEEAARGGSTSTTRFPRAGDRLLGFHLIRELGRGAIGRVYLAEQADLAHRHVALKVTTEVTVEPERLAQLQHEHIVPIYSLHRYAGLQVVCMPYYGDRTLVSWLRDQRRAMDSVGDGSRQDTAEVRADDTTAFPPDSKPQIAGGAGRDREWTQATVATVQNDEHQALRIMHGVVSGLAHAHQRGIIHRDLKPANILLRDDGQPLLLDFNLAANLREGDPRSEGVGGTLPYMSPEQLAALETGAPVDARADVFGCGVLLFEMLTGERPYPDVKAQGRVLWRALRERRLTKTVELDRLDRQSTPDVASIVLKCLAPLADDRYASAVELAEDLRRHLENLPLRHAANRSWRERSRKWVRRHPRLGSGTTVAIAAAILLSFAIAAVVLRDRQVAQLNAVITRDAYLRSAPEIRAALTAPDIEPALVAEAVVAGDRLLAPYLSDDGQDWQGRPLVQCLAEHERQQLIDDAEGMMRDLALAASRLAPSETENIAYRRWRARAYRPNTTVSSPNSTSQSDEWSSLRSEVRHLVREREYAAAIAPAQRWVETSPQDYEAHFLLGNALAGCGRADEAEQCFSICTVLAPSSHLAYFQRGVCRLELKMWLGAGDDFSRVLTLRPRLAAALVNRALALRELDRMHEAIDDLTLAIGTGQAPTRVYFLRGQLYSLQSRTAEAAADRAMGLKLVPNDVQSWVARGIARLPADLDGALADFQAALQLNPRYRAALLHSAGLLSDGQGNNEAALAPLDNLLRDSPSDIDARAARAVLLARLGRAQEALDDVSALVAKPRTALNVYRAACVYSLLSRQRAEHRADALRWLAVALAQDSQYIDIAAKDPDFVDLRDDQKFQEILTAAQALRAAGQAPPQPQQSP